MKSTAMTLVVAVALLASVLSGHAFEGPFTQSAQPQLDYFDGNWVGSGANARPIFRTRCGNGPLVEITIQDGATMAVFKAFVKGKARSGLRSHLIRLSGAIDRDGKLELSGYESSATVNLSASDGLGEGTWEFRKLVCHGSFRGRRKQ